MVRLLRIWLAAFALVHVYWALGGRIGVPAEAAPIGDRPVFLAYDLVAAVLLGVGAVVLRRVPARVLWCAALALLLRGLGGLVQDAVLAIGGDLPYGWSVGYDVWFSIAGALLVVLARGRAPAGQSGHASDRRTLQRLDEPQRHRSGVPRDSDARPPRRSADARR